MVKSGKNSQTGGMGGRVPDLGKIPTFSRFFLGQRPLEFMLDHEVLQVWMWDIYFIGAHLFHWDTPGRFTE